MFTVLPFAQYKTVRPPPFFNSKHVTCKTDDCVRNQITVKALFKSILVTGHFLLLTRLARLRPAIQISKANT